MKPISVIRVIDSEFYFIFLFSFSFLFFYIFDLELGFSITSYVIVTNYHSYKSHNHML